jgi:hypothetical protein
MKKISLIVLFIVSLVNLQAQNCPSSISVIAPSSEVLTGSTFQFSVYMNGLPVDISPTYNWTISSGSIVSGQGTSMITVDPGSEAGTCTATVEIGGLPAKCNRMASATADIRKAAEKIISTQDVSARSLQDAVKKFVAKTDLTNIAITQASLVNIYTTNAQQFIKLKAIMEKAFQVNGIYTYQYNIVDAGVNKTAAVDIFLVKNTY